MGYRLHAGIPNVKHEKAEMLELGKQYDSKWGSFNDTWFGADQDSGFIYPEDLDGFYEYLLETNQGVSKYKLYNLELLKEMFEFAKEQDYLVYFISY